MDDIKIRPIVWLDSKVYREVLTAIPPQERFRPASHLGYELISCGPIVFGLMPAKPDTRLPDHA